MKEGKHLRSWVAGPVCALSVLQRPHPALPVAGALAAEVAAVVALKGLGDVLPGGLRLRAVRVEAAASPASARSGLQYR